MRTTRIEIDHKALQMRMSRIFEADSDPLFRAYTDRHEIAKWWGGHGNPTLVELHDARPGGGWRYILWDASGKQHRYRGQFQELGPRRIGFTYEYDGMPGRVVRAVVDLEDLEGGRTRVRSVSTFATAEDLDAWLQAGAESAANAAWEALAELVERPPSELRS